MEKTPVFASMQKRFSDHLAVHLLLKSMSTQKILSRSKSNCSGARHIYREQKLRNIQPKL